MENSTASGDNDAKVSLHGLDPLEALRALLRVDPNSEPVADDDHPEGDDVSRNDA